MKIYLLRHGETDYNAQQRYQGWRDIPLSEKGRAALKRAPFSPHTVYVSPLCRAGQTARLLFPDAALVPVDDLREMHFGVFEGRNYLEMADDPAYRAWVDSGCEDPIPGGERKVDFCARVCAAFAPLVDRALEAGEQTLVIVAHGGTQMAVMERYALPRQAYYTWKAPNGGGYVLDACRWREDHTLTLLDKVRYTKEEAL
jgi:alpha-ribazole phosphatase